MKILRIKEPISCGIIMSYKCSSECKHCMYACSPRWSNDWIKLEDLKVILSNLAVSFSKVYPKGIRGVLGINYGLHFTGGEPFLNFKLLVKAVQLAKEMGIPGVFVETNCFWCVNDDVTRKRLNMLKEVGLDGILISANPFLLEYVPFENIKRAVRISSEIYGRNNVMIYHPIFYEQFISMNIRGTMKFEEYVEKILSLKGRESLLLSFSPGIVLPMGRLPYKVGQMYKHYPAKTFFKENCIEELTRPWHVHIDCYCNYIPGYCAGISLGDARRLHDLIQGIDLDDKPILHALMKGLYALYDLAVKEYGYRELKEGYISKCHLCVDIRRHIALMTKEFKELQPREFYFHLT